MEWNREFRWLVASQMLCAVVLLLVDRFTITDERISAGVLSIAVGFALAVVIQVIWCGVSSELKRKVK